MAWYAIHGGRLRSEILIPELRETTAGTPDWTFDVVDRLEPLLDPVLLGEELLIPGISARLARGRDAFHLAFDDTGEFRVSLDGRTIQWCPSIGADHSLARIDLIGRVLALAVHVAGDVCLHASGVSIGDQGIAFLGPKGFGKSTLALSLVAAGARLLSDDMVRVRLRNPITAAPGPSGIRLWSDSADLLGRRHQAHVEPDGGKLVVAQLDEIELAVGEAPLAALYLLAPIAGSSTAVAGVTRERLGPTQATLALVPHAKLAPLLGHAEGGALLRQVSEAARQVPVYRLAIVRDLPRLSDVAEQILSWHRP